MLEKMVVKATTTMMIIYFVSVSSTILALKDVTVDSVSDSRFNKPTTHSHSHEKGTNSRNTYHTAQALGKHSHNTQRGRTYEH